jgi:ABC-type enterochelin transport system ATPase subunit
VPPAIVSFETAALVHFGKRPASRNRRSREDRQRVGAEVKCWMLMTDRFSTELTPLTATSVTLIDAMQ